MEAGVPINILGWATLTVHKSANRAFMAFLQLSVQLQLSSAVLCSTLRSSLGLSTSCSRFFKEFPRYSSKRCSKQSKVAFCHESCSKVVRESIFVQFWGVTCVAKQLWLQLKPKKIVERTSSPETFKSRRVWIFVHHSEFSLKTAGLAAQLLLSCAHDLLQGGGFGSFFFLQEIHKLSTKTLRNMEERPD